MSRVVISGPMRGYPNLNHAAFDECERALHEYNLDTGVYNPARVDRAHGVSTEDGLDPRMLQRLMGDDLAAVLASDRVVVLPGWERSEGAKLEVAVALTAGIPVYRFVAGRWLVPLRDAKVEQYVTHRRSAS
jgi:hypothetical protein